MKNIMKVAKIAIFKTMSTKEISDMTGVRHDNVMRAIEELNEANILTPQSEESEYKTRGKVYKCWNLTKRDSLVLIARLSPEFTAAVVDRWQELETKEATKQQEAITRSEARLEFRPMTDAIVAMRADQGKSVAPHHFSNEADLINRIALGMPASKFRQLNDIEAGEPIRDRMTPMQVKAVLALQRANTAYLEEGVSFDDRKARLQTLYDRRYKSAMIEETIYLNA